MTKIADISIIERLLADLQHMNPNRSVSANAADLLTTYMESSREDAWWEFLSIVGTLQSLALEIQSRGARRAVDGAVVALGRIFGPDLVSVPTAAWLEATAAERAVVENAILLFDDLDFDNKLALTAAPELIDEIDRLRGAIGQNEQLSDPVKQVLFGQLDLLIKSMEHLRSGGVGPFRTSVFTIFGRIYVEMKSKSTAEAAAIRTVLDDISRVIAVVEVGGGIAKLAGPAVTLLLTQS